VFAGRLQSPDNPSQLEALAGAVGVSKFSGSYHSELVASSVGDDEYVPSSTAFRELKH